jgi:hypothetical protein
MRTGILSLLTLLLWVSSIHADIIHYKDGRKLEGVIVERSDELLKVQTSFGTIDVPMSKVSRIEQKLTPEQELAERRATLSDDDAASLWILASWADEQRLRKEYKALVQEVLAADPEHEQANLSLGKLKTDGRWFTPQELDDYRKEVEVEKRAQGLVLYDGEWIPEADANRKKGLELYEGEWMPRREAHVRRALVDLATVGGWSTQATEGEFVTIFGDLDEESLEYLIYDLDAAVRHFLEQADPTEEERKRLVGYEVPIYLLPDQETSLALLEGDYFERYPVFDDLVERWKDMPAYGMNWPKPFLVLVGGGHLAQRGDADSSRTGLLSHQLGRLFIDRFKGNRSAPGWTILGMAAYYEGTTNYYSTVSLTTEGLDVEGDPTGQWVRGWEHFGEWRDKLREEGVHGSLPAMKRWLGDDIAVFDSKGVGLAWSLTRFLLDKHSTEFFDYLRAFDSNPFEVAKDLRKEHERAWALSFASTVDELEEEWRDWALSQPPRFPTDELDR